jgi:hypothetical protein
VIWLKNICQNCVCGSEKQVTDKRSQQEVQDTKTDLTARNWSKEKHYLYPEFTYFSNKCFGCPQ